MTKPFSFEEASKPSDITTSGAFSFEDALKPVVEPDTGFTGGFKSAAARLKGEAALTAGKLGIMDQAKAEQYLKEKEEEANSPRSNGGGGNPFRRDTLC